MSGHSKWSTIKHKKAATDAKRGKLFNRIIREITVAARLGGREVEANSRLRTAVAAGRTANIPATTIEKAIKKGMGELGGDTIEEVTYEGYGPGGVAILIKTTTDNKNRTVSDVRSLLCKYGGNMGEVGSVNWMFIQKGLIVISKEQISESDLMDIVLEAGAEDLKTEEDSYEITTSVEEFEAVKRAVGGNNLKTTICELTMIPQSTVPLDKDKALSMLKLMDQLENQDDVQKVYANFDIPNEIMESVFE